jgi:SAM-dependent methyltransferase
MDRQISGRVWDILRCPYCEDPLSRSDQSASCGRCGSRYGSAASGALDLRLRQPKEYAYPFVLGLPLLPESGFDFSPLVPNDAPQVNYDDFPVPFHLSRAMLSHFPKARTASSLMLDLGCGNTVHRVACEHAGFEYVGLDYNAAAAPILGDAHALPFRSESFEFVLSMAVLEHIRFPFVMMREVYRVLQPRGIFIGTVAFLEPFHGDSFYHHTHLGTYNSLREGGFRIQHVCPSDTWSGLTAQANMGLFPRMPPLVSRSLVMPVQMMHRIWWRLGSLVCAKSSEETRITSTTGSFTFIAHKDAS